MEKYLVALYHTSYSGDRYAIIDAESMETIDEGFWNPEEAVHYAETMLVWVL